MGYGIRVETWGDYALFSRPEMKVERVSYDVITPSAARGLLEAIYWHPGLTWRIDRIYVQCPIRFTNVRRNEVNSKASAGAFRTMANGGEPPSLATSQDICQRASLLLRDVRYVLEAHFTLDQTQNPEMTPEKAYNIMLRRLRKGQCYHQPCFGCREFPARFQLYEGAKEPATAYPDEEERDLGYMLYDLDYSNMACISPIFFRASLKRGVLDLRGLTEEALVK